MPYKDPLQKRLYNQRPDQKQAQKIRSRRWYLKNKEHAIALAHEWIVNNRERRREIARDWQRQWKLNHPDEYKAAIKKYQPQRNAYARLHPEQGRMKSQRHEARKHSAPGNLTKEQWDAIKVAYKQRCAYCGQKKALTVDHAIPLAKGGTHDCLNIVPACLSCNGRKCDSLDGYIAPVRLLL